MCSSDLNPDWLPKEKWFGSESQEWFIGRVRELAIEHEGPKPILQGRHLIEHFGMEPSPEFKQILDSVFEMQMDGSVTTLEEAIEAVKKIGH